MASASSHTLSVAEGGDQQSCLLDSPCVPCLRVAQQDFVSHIEPFLIYLEMAIFFLKFQILALCHLCLKWYKPQVLRPYIRWPHPAQGPSEVNVGPFSY